MLLTRAFPLAILALPLTVNFIRIGLYDTPLGVALIHTVLALPFAALVTQSLFLGIPREYEEAAWVFGCTRLQAFRRVVLPLALPGLAATAIFAFVISWNEVFAASVLTVRERTLTAYLLTVLSESPLHYRFAGGFLLIVPSVAFIFAVRKYLFAVWGVGSKSAMADIVIDGMSKSFGAHTALQEISLTVADGEFVALLGPSGCGKTTLLRILAGLETESGGAITIGGKRMNGLAPRERGLAMVFQNYAVFPHMTVAENIGFGLAMQKKPQDVIDAAGEESRGAAAHRAVSRPLSRQALGRPAPARRRRARARRRAGRAADGRAAVEPRRAAAPGDAHGTQGRAARGRHDDDLRHPRPDRGHGPRRPHRRHVRRAHRSDRHAARRLRAARRRASSAASSAARR